MKEFDKILKDYPKIKRFQFQAKHLGRWFDVCSINKKTRAIRLYNEYGVYKTSLESIEKLVLAETNTFE